MSEEQSKPLAAFFALLPIGLLLIIEFFAESLQSAEKLIPHLAFGVLIAQLLCLVAFIKGEICPGQRGRLIKANGCFALYWLVWLGMSLASPHHYVMTDIVSLCGLSAVYAVWKQPKDEVARRGFLLMASLVSGLGVIAYLMIFFGNPTPNFVQYNQFAQAAAKGVSEAPGLKFNPFFIYGGVGLGKTHLMHAIGNQILENNPSAKILYITSETFTNQLVNALKDQTTENFREKYRSIDALLIDDIQFIAGKKSTQEEFFHTFNALYESGKQIILTCDRPPKELELLEERLKSRFEWGLLADISNPDYETRLAILRQKADLDNILINDDILTLIATNVDSNIRALEGILKKLIAKASLTNSPITIEMAQNAIDTMITSKEKVISSEYIQEVIGKYFDINPSDLTSSKRSADVTFPRQIAMYNGIRKVLGKTKT